MAFQQLRGTAVRRAAVLLSALVFTIFVITQNWAGNPITSSTVLAAAVSGLSLGAIYALAASGLVVTYTTTGIFNFAQGAIGMIMAYVYWQLSQGWHWSQPVSIVLVVFVIAPAFGVLLYQLLMRHLVGADLVVQIMATIGLMVGLMGLAAFFWSPQDFRQVPYFFNGEGFHVGDTFVLWHRAIAIVAGVVIAVGLRLFLRRTRTGLAMRAVVDDPELAALHAAPPSRISALAWAIGSSLAAVAGLLLAPEVQLSVEGLTLLIFDAFAAAILGRLRSLPLTVAGGVLIGVLNAFALGFLNFTGRWTNFAAAIPTVVLLFALLALPAARIQVGRTRARLRARVPKLWEAAAGAGLLVVVVAIAGSRLSLVNQNRLTVGIITALLLVSLVPLIGWAGQVSLAPMAFAGIGAFAMLRWAQGGGLSGLVLGGLIAIPFGLVVALPALRLRGLYFALASVAFARLMELLFFTQADVLGSTSADSKVGRPTVVGIDMNSQRSFLLFTAVLFAIVGFALIALRRSRYGRRLMALRDSEAATTTVGLDVRLIKFSVFALSAFLGAVAGGLLAIQRGTPTAGDFTMFSGLALTLFLVVGGVALVTGALLAGLVQFGLIVLSDNWVSRYATLLEAAGPAFAAIGLARNPYGAAGDIGAAVSRFMPWRRPKAPPPASGPLSAGGPAPSASPAPADALSASVTKD